MDFTPLPPGPPDIDALDRYLLSEQAADNGMGLSDLDGFLTGIAIGPDLILPSEWLPAVWGGEAPRFASDAEMASVMGAIMGRYNEILAGLACDPPWFEPIIWENPDGMPIADDWAFGFLDAVDLRRDAWMPLLTSRRRRTLFVPFLLLVGDEDEVLADCGVAPGDAAALYSELAEAIPDCVTGIDAFWKRRRQRPAVPRAKAGRNDPCPCGSGAKFKVCCGKG